MADLAFRIRTPLGRVNKSLADKIDAKLTKFNQVEYRLKNGSEEQRKNLFHLKLLHQINYMVNYEMRLI